MSSLLFPTTHLWSTHHPSVPAMIPRAAAIRFLVRTFMSSLAWVRADSPNQSLGTPSNALASLMRSGSISAVKARTSWLDLRSSTGVSPRQRTILSVLGSSHRYVTRVLPSPHSRRVWRDPPATIWRSPSASGSGGASMVLSDGKRADLAESSIGTRSGSGGGRSAPLFGECEGFDDDPLSRYTHTKKTPRPVIT